MKNDKLGVKKVKKARKSGRETLTLHVKKCKKTSKIGFHAHFRFHAKKKKNTARYRIFLFPRKSSFFRIFEEFRMNEWNPAPHKVSGNGIAALPDEWK